MKKILIVTFCTLLIFALPLSVSAAGIGEGAVGALVSEKFEEWVLPHLEEISVVVTLIFTAFYNMRKHKLLSRSMGTMNHNTVTVAEQSARMMSQASAGLESAALAVKGYEARMEELLEAYRQSGEDRERLEADVREMREYCRTATQANVEFANELAELLSLANIPNYKKEEIGARHMAAVRSIAGIESETLSHTEEVHTDLKEVLRDVGEEA